MSYRLEIFSDVGLDEALLKLLIDGHESGVIPKLNKWWSYYRNPLGLGNRTVGGGQQAQEKGLPERLTGVNESGVRREVVIENDIAWRLHTMVDFMFGKPVLIVSTAEDEQRRRVIEKLLDAVWEASGGIGLLQDMALLGHVYGYVDLLVRVEGLVELEGDGIGFGDELSDERIREIARAIRIEVVEPTRCVPLVNSLDYRGLDAYVVHFDRELNQVERSVGGVGSVIGRLLRGGDAGGARRRSSVTEVWSGSAWQVYEGEELVGEGLNRYLAGHVPVVHIQNLSQPFRYEGLGEVEQLVCLQDELNTRLSDRASRVTMQSFKMYLARGVEGFERVPVGPGQVWSTDNPDARIESFGGDAESPSEESHIREIREAMDKVSSVPPLASGVVRARIGNLSSATALKVTLMGILSKTARKRVTYGRGIVGASEMVLMALDAAGVFQTDVGERGLRLAWPDPLPTDERDQVFAARAKQDLGVPVERVLAELGYAPSDPGVM